MKKLFAGIIATFLMGAGLVGISGEAAQAACPYTGCVRTYTHVNASDTVRGGHSRICVRVTTASGQEPKGQITIRVTKSVGSYRFIDSKRYNGPRTCFTTPRLRKPGKYVVGAFFDRKPGSPFKDSDNRTTFRVKRHR